MNRNILTENTQIYATFFRNPVYIKPVGAEFAELDRVKKELNLYKSNDTIIEAWMFEKLVSESIPLTACSWYDSEFTKNKMKHFKTNVIALDFDNGIKNVAQAKQLEQEFSKYFHFWQKSMSYGDESKPEDERYRYHCFMILDTVITDVLLRDAVYNHIGEKFSNKFNIPYDMSINFNKTLLSSSHPVHTNWNLELFSIEGINVLEGEVSKGVVVTSEIDEDRLIDALGSLNWESLAYLTWKSIPFALSYMVETGQISEGTAEYIITENDCSKKSNKNESLDAYMRARDAGIPANGNVATFGSIYHILNNNGISTEGICKRTKEIVTEDRFDRVIHVYCIIEV